MKNALLIVGAGIVGIIILLVGYPAFVRQQPVAPLAHAPAHGVSFILEVESAKTESATNDLGLLKAAVLKRSDRVGLRIYWEVISETQVRVAVAAQNSGEGERLRRALFRPGQLEFRLVHEDSDRMIAAGELPPGYELLQHEEGRTSGGRRTERVIIKKKSEAGLSGSLIKKAMVTRGNLGEPEIHFTMQPEAGVAFAKVTRDNVGRRLAIVVDGELYSAPNINSPIETGTGMITGGFDAQEALEIAGALDCPLPFSVKVVELRGY